MYITLKHRSFCALVSGECFDSNVIQEISLVEKVGQLNMGHLDTSLFSGAHLTMRIFRSITVAMQAAYDQLMKEG